MKIDLCKIFGVEEGELFKIEDELFDNDVIYKIKDNILLNGFREDNLDWSFIGLNQIKDIDIKNIIKLPKRKSFLDDELAIMRSLPKEFKWIARDDDGELYLYGKKPKISKGIWNDNYSEKCNNFDYFEHLFKSITSEDEEPVFIDDYVERI